MEPSSPIHASFLDSSKIRPRNDENNPDLSSPSFIAPGAGSPSLGAASRGTRSFSNSRRTRRLQLRNAGFRGPNVPGRRVTPAISSSTPATTTWSTGQTSDIENMSPSGRKERCEDEDGAMDGSWSTTERGLSRTGVLQDIVNSSAVRRTKPSVTASKSWTNADASDALVALDDDRRHSNSPPTQRSSSTATAKSRSLRAKAKLNRGRRSASREAREYIDYLEESLGSALAQVDAMASDNVTARQQSDSLRHLRAEHERVVQEMTHLQSSFDDRLAAAGHDHTRRFRALEQENKLLQEQSVSQQSELERLRQSVFEASSPATVEDAKSKAIRIDGWRETKYEYLEEELRVTKEKLEKSEARNAELEGRHEVDMAGFARSPSPGKAAFSPTPARRGRPLSMPVSVLTQRPFTMSPERFPPVNTRSPMSPHTRRLSRDPMSPLANVYSPDVSSPIEGSSDYGASPAANAADSAPDTIPRTRFRRRFQSGTAPKTLLLAEMSNTSTQQPQSPLLPESGDEHSLSKTPTNEHASGSPHPIHRRSSTESDISKPSRKNPGLRINTSRTLRTRDSRRSSIWESKDGELVNFFTAKDFMESDSSRTVVNGNPTRSSLVPLGSVAGPEADDYRASPDQNTMRSDIASPDRLSNDQASEAVSRTNVMAGPDSSPLRSPVDIDTMRDSIVPFDLREIAALSYVIAQNEAHQSAKAAYHRRLVEGGLRAATPGDTVGPGSDTDNLRTYPDKDTRIFSTASMGSTDEELRDFSSGNYASAKPFRTLYDELNAAREPSFGTIDEHLQPDHSRDNAASPAGTVQTVLHSRLSDSEVAELPEDNEIARAASPTPQPTALHRAPAVSPASAMMVTQAATAGPAILPAIRSPSPLSILERKPYPMVMQQMANNRANSSASSMASQISASTLSAVSRSTTSTMDSLRTVLSNLFHSPIDVVKHIVQMAQSRMSIPRPLLSIQWWLVGLLFGPMARRGMLGRPSAASNDEEQALLGNVDDNDLCYSAAYQTPQGSPSLGSTASSSMVAGTGKKRVALLPGVGGGDAAKSCIHQPRRWKHSPWLWLKFSMCLAVAVGVACKEGPSSLLKEAVCQACKGKKSANWRQANREEPPSPPS